MDKRQNCLLTASLAETSLSFLLFENENRICVDCTRRLNSPILSCRRPCRRRRRRRRLQRPQRRRRLQLRPEPFRRATKRKGRTIDRMPIAFMRARHSTYFELLRLVADHVGLRRLACHFGNRRRDGDGGDRRARRRRLLL